MSTRNKHLVNLNLNPNLEKSHLFDEVSWNSFLVV